jgi:hypothetical protein
MDADVISIETSRLKMELLDAFTGRGYPNEIGPGVYDIHSPRVPDISEIEALLRLTRGRLADSQIWINQDWGRWQIPASRPWRKAGEASGAPTLPLSPSGILLAPDEGSQVCPETAKRQK